MNTLVVSFSTFRIQGVTLAQHRQVLQGQQHPPETLCNLDLCHAKAYHGKVPKIPKLWFQLKIKQSFEPFI